VDSYSGANIIVKSTKVNTQTDFDGKFTIKANAKQIIGQLHWYEFCRNACCFFNDFKLSEAANELESIVVVGYGTLSKKN
jgi:hypothetical protein